MQILCCAELSSSLSRYDGIKFGHRADTYNDIHELYALSRTEAFGEDVKLAALVGAMALSQEYYDKYYDKAMRIRRLIKESISFDSYDAIIMPSAGVDPSSAVAQHALPRLCGLPAAAFMFNGECFTLTAGARREDVLRKALKAVGL